MNRTQELRQQKQMTINELAVKAGVSRYSIILAEEGTRLTAETLFKIANALDTTIADLLGEKIPAFDGMHPGMEFCEFCHVQYHPMTVWTRAYGDRIHVCDPGFHRAVNSEYPGCEELAIEAGFVKRDDLTPSR